jgi:RNA polymerase sigma-70 factor (ECF subfamily)
MNAAHAELPTFPAALRMPPPAAQARPEVPADAELPTLVAAIGNGEQRALERFYRKTLGRVFGLALRIVRCRATAEEVAEDVYVQIWHSAASYDPRRGSPLAWALTITRSRAIDALRRADEAIVDPDPGTRADALTEPTPGLQDLLQATQQNAALHAALARLRPEQRQLLSLAFFRGLTHPEIVAASGLPLGTVKSHIRRALGVLRDDLGPD